MSRPPLTPEKARSVTLVVRVRPAGAKALREAAREHGMTVSDALREAMGMWIERKAGKR